MVGENSIFCFILTIFSIFPFNDYGILPEEIIQISLEAKENLLKDHLMRYIDTKGFRTTLIQNNIFHKNKDFYENMINLFLRDLKELYIFENNVDSCKISKQLEKEFVKYIYINQLPDTALEDNIPYFLKFIVIILHLNEIINRRVFHNLRITNDFVNFKTILRWIIRLILGF